MKRKKTGSGLLIAAEALVLVVVLVLSLTTAVFAGGKHKTKKAKETAQTDENAVSDSEMPDAFNEGALVFDDAIEEKIASMTTEEKVAQIFLVTPEDFTGNPEVTVAGDGCKSAIEARPIGGMIVSRANFLDKDTTADNLGNLQSYSEERIGNDMLLVIEQGAEGNEAVATTDYMKENGANAIRLNTYVPAVDADPATIEEEITNTYTDYQDQGMLGLVTFAPDQVMAADGASEDSLTNYRNGFAKSIKDAWGMQMGSGTCKLVTGKEELSLTLSADAVKIIRNEMNYNGLLVSGALSDEAISGGSSIGEAAVQAVCAGMSMLYVPSGFDEAYQAVLAAANEGTITDTMLHNAVGRILVAKQAMRDENAADQAQAEADAKAAEEAARQQAAAQQSQNNNRSNRNNNGNDAGNNNAAQQAANQAAAEQAAAEAAAAQQAAAEEAARAQEAANQAAAEQAAAQQPEAGQ